MGGSESLIRGVYPKWISFCNRLYQFIPLVILCAKADAHVLHVGQKFEYQQISKAIASVVRYDTIIVHGGEYKEGNITIYLPITLIGVDLPVIDGQKRFECLSLRSDSIHVTGFKIQHSGMAMMDDPGGIKCYNSNGSVIEGNILDDNFFGIYLSQCRNCVVHNNKIFAKGTNEQQIGNGIHCWKCDSIQIIGNHVTGQRDGIYFEFVTHAIIWRNVSAQNVRYGIHFMFSNDDAYISNVFRNNGAGVAVMFSKRVTMINNYFEDNWGDAAYGILLKEISDSYIINNHFVRNTAGLYLEGASRMMIEGNVFEGNGWGMKIQASCMDNVIHRNNFVQNTFDCSTNGDLVLNSFNENYWDQYEGYDLNKDGVGDIPYHPLSLFSVIVERNPPVMLLFRSFMVTLLDHSEKVLPSLTPENFKDDRPFMKPYML